MVFNTTFLIVFLYLFRYKQNTSTKLKGDLRKMKEENFLLAPET